MKNKERIDKILAYIHDNYREKITADSIAAHINVSRGECFRCFKQYMDIGLAEYINKYRLEKSLELIRETDMKIVDIGPACGFEYANYFGRLFKETYRITPLRYRKSHIRTDSFLETIDGYRYQYWKDEGTGKMTITGNAGNGSFTCSWDKINYTLFRSGKSFPNRDKTPAQIGGITLEFDVEHNPYGTSWLCVYGWMIDPLVEWYIIEDYSTFKPAGNGELLGTIETDGGSYNLHKSIQKNSETILGTIEDFPQYWSVRDTCRTKGTVDVIAHFRAWEKTGLPMGNLTEVSLSVESWVSSGKAAVHKNVVTASQHPLC